ncbi:kinase-like protein [Lophium mytilinum]|uniref:EKC/KEOPS complex subunit BUD32 n=1 Tax=Lophium mytilinum TaxID=390894 RepID=A0A6A6QRB4_9PEZI|nr:kinase-like protein [Lophium mytilinum]
MADSSQIRNIQPLPPFSPSTVQVSEEWPPYHPVYQWADHHGVEDLEHYCTGGDHPTHIGERYHNDRYKIIQKLGHSSYSLAWLARDTVEEKNVALKILQADQPTYSRERDILRLVTENRANYSGSVYVASLLDDFIIEGPNGKHLCLVMPIAGCSVAQSKHECRPYKHPLRVSRSIAAQVLLGMEYIHSCGVVHGDLSSNNILFQIPGLAELNEDELYLHIGEPNQHEVRRYDNRPLGPEVPKHCVSPAMLFLNCDELEKIQDPQIIITDFGEAFLAASHNRDQLMTPISLLPPEQFFHEPLGPKSDTWTLACTLIQILDRNPIFETWLGDEDAIIADMIGALGPLPGHWWEKWDAKDKYFSEDGSWKEGKGPPYRSLAENLVSLARGKRWETAEMRKDEFTAREDLIKRMLVYESADRITVEEAVASEWVQKWAIPDITEADPQRLLGLLRETCDRFQPIFKEQTELEEAQNAADAAETDDLLDEDEKKWLKQYADELTEQRDRKHEEKMDKDSEANVVPGKPNRVVTWPPNGAWRILMLSDWMKEKDHQAGKGKGGGSGA